MQDLRKIIDELYRSETEARHQPAHYDVIGVDGIPVSYRDMDVSDLDGSNGEEGQAPMVQSDGSLEYQDIPTQYGKTDDVVISVPGDYPTLKAAVDSIDFTILPVNARVVIEIEEGTYSGAGWNRTITAAHPQADRVDIVGLGNGAEITTTLENGKTVETSVGELTPFIHVDDVELGRIENIAVYGESTSDDDGGLLVTGSSGAVDTNSKFEFRHTGRTFGIGVHDGAFVNATNADVSNNGNRDEFDAGGSRENDSAGDHGTGQGLWIINSAVAIADQSTANRCGNTGIRSSRGSIVTCENATAEDCGHHNILATRGSTMYAHGGDFTGAMDDCAVAIDGSILEARDADFSGAGETHGVVATGGSRLNCEDATITDCGSDNIVANRNSMVNADNVTCTGGGRDGLAALRGSTINAQDANVNGTGRNGVLAYHCATVAFNTGDASNTGDVGIEATRASRIMAEGATITGNPSGNVDANGASTISVHNADCTGAGDHGMRLTVGRPSTPRRPT